MMLVNLILCGFILTVAAEPIGRHLQPLNPYTPGGRIVGGEAVSIQEIPYQVSLQASGFAFCGGSIISSEWILTAGHCMVYSAQYITVRAGSTYRSSGGTLHKVRQTIRHENYKTNWNGIPENDVALIRLETPLKLDSSRKAVQMFNSNEESVAGLTSLISGWGAVKQGGSTSEELRAVRVPVVSKQSCSAAYSAFGGVPAGQICAAYPQGGKDACQGDSGGPLTINGRQAGITSWGNGCAQRGYPGVYTEVAAFRSWIAQKTGL